MERKRERQVRECGRREKVDEKRKKIYRKHINGRETGREREEKVKKNKREKGNKKEGNV